MPQSKQDDTAAMLDEDAIRQRAYFMWEADGRPDGRGEHYWHLAHQEASNAMVEATAARTARITGGKNPSEMPLDVKGGAKPPKSKLKARVADEPKAKPAKKAKPVEPKAAKKEPKPRAAVVKPL